MVMGLAHELIKRTQEHITLWATVHEIFIETVQMDQI